MTRVPSAFLLWIPAALGLVLASISACATAAPLEKPLPGVDAEWSMAAPLVPGGVVTGVLRVTARIPGLGIRVSVPGADSWFLDDPPAFRGNPTAGEPMEFPVVLRVPREPRPLEAVVEVESAAGRYEVHALLDVPHTPAARGQRGASTTRGDPVTEFAAASGTPVTPRTGFIDSASPTVVLTGRFYYRDRLIGPDGFVNQNLLDEPTKPIRFADVDLLENGVPVAAGFTDSTGAFALNATPSGGETYQVRVTSSTAEWGAADVRVRFSPSNLTLYGALSASVQNPGGDTDLGDFVVNPGQGGEAFNVLDMGLEGMRQIEMFLGSYPVYPLSYYWNASPGLESQFHNASLSIDLSPDDAYDDPLVLHEFGHYLTWIYSKDENPGGLHYIDDPAQDVRLTWSEGFAGYFQASVRSRLGEPFPSWYVDTFGGAGAGQLYFSYDLEWPSFRLVGIGSELAVQAALWDIEDGDATPGDADPGIDDDPLDATGFDIWEVITGPMKSASTVSMEDFWDGWFDPSVNNGFRTEMEQVFTALGMEFYPDGFEDDDAPGNASPIAPDGSPHHHTFYSVADEDHHRLDLAAGEQIMIETLGILSYGDTFVELLDSTLTVIGSNDNRGPGNLASLLYFTANEAGTYVVRVRRSFLDPRAQLADYGSYDVRVVHGVHNPVLLVPVSAGVSSSRQGVGVAFADYNADGYADLYVTNNSGAGSAQGLDQLFRNNGDFTFDDATIAAGLGNPDGEVGVAWGDFDNDGDPDLFVTDHGFFRNEGGTFTDNTSASNLFDIGREFDAAWVDADVDGHLDLFVVRRDGPSALWHNNGDGTFTDVAPGAGFGFPGDGGDAFSGVWGDYDNDGLPDLFMTRRGDPFHSLYRNLGNNQFIDVTDSAHVSGVDPAVGGIWGDVNDDGWLDLFVCSYGWNRLYVNEGDGTFVDRAGLYGVRDYDTSYGGLFFDYDLDGDLDLYVVNVTSANAHYENLGGGTMIRTPLAADPGVGYGAAWADVDNDGDLELYLSRGCVANQQCQSNRLYENNATQATGRRWLKVALSGVDSNRDGIGASIFVHTSAGVQHRQVGTGVGWASKSRVPELYGFLDGVTVDSVEVRWPSGVVDMVRGPVLNTVLTVVEGSVTPVLPEPGISPVIALTAPFPNPFLGATTMAVTVSRGTEVTVDIFDASGRRVRVLAQRRFEKGTHIVGWNGRTDLGDPAPPGVYFYRVAAAGDVQVKKLVRLGDGR